MESKQSLVICLAETIIRIFHRYEYVRRLCAEYVLDDECIDTEGGDVGIDFEIDVSEKDIHYERQRSLAGDQKFGRDSLNYHDAYLESLAVYRKIAENLMDSNIVLMHGSVISVDGEAYLFAAPSGTGKSTHTALWRKVLGDRAIMVNDDKPLIKIGAEEVRVYGTPWDGKHHLSTNTSVPLKAICLLHRGEVNRIQEVESTKCLTEVLPYVYRSKEPQKLIKAITLVDQMTKQLKVYELFCNTDDEAARVAYEAMKG